MSVAQALSTLARLDSLHGEADHLARAVISNPTSGGQFAGALHQKLLEQKRLLEDLKRQIDDIEEAD